MHGYMLVFCTHTHIEIGRKVYALMQRLFSVQESRIATAPEVSFLRRGFNLYAYAREQYRTCMFSTSKPNYRMLLCFRCLIRVVRRGLLQQRGRPSQWFLVSMDSNNPASLGLYLSLCILFCSFFQPFSANTRCILAIQSLCTGISISSKARLTRVIACHHAVRRWQEDDHHLMRSHTDNDSVLHFEMDST